MRSHQVEVKPLPPLSHSLLVSFQNQPPKRCVRSPDLACTSNLGALPCTLPPLPALWVSLLKAGPEVVAQSHDPNQVSNNSEDNHPMCLTTFMGNIPPPLPIASQNFSCISLHLILPLVTSGCLLPSFHLGGCRQPLGLFFPSSTLGRVSPTPLLHWVLLLQSLIRLVVSTGLPPVYPCLSYPGKLRTGHCPDLQVPNRGQ